MTRERAEEIRKAIHRKGCYGSGPDDGGATPAEIAEIKAVWAILPGHFSFYDAVRIIADPPDWALTE